MNPLLKSLRTATFKVMEMMYFLLPEEEPPTGPSVYIGITGKPGYRISFTFDTTIAHRMARDLLSVSESDVTAELIDQTLKETANIIAGNYLHEFDAAENRNLTMPSTVKGDIFDGADGGAHEQFDIYYEGQKVTVAIETIP